MQTVRNNAKALFDKGMKEKSIFKRLVKCSGGFEETFTNANFPNSYNQIYGLRRKQKSNNTKDEIVDSVVLFHVQKDLLNAFIRDVRLAPELDVGVKNDQLLQDILKFYVMDHCCSIVGVDPTFNMCSSNIVQH